MSKRSLRCFSFRRVAKRACRAVEPCYSLEITIYDVRTCIWEQLDGCFRARLALSRTCKEFNAEGKKRLAMDIALLQVQGMNTCSSIWLEWQQDSFESFSERLLPCLHLARDAAIPFRITWDILAHSIMVLMDVPGMCTVNFHALNYPTAPALLYFGVHPQILNRCLVPIPDSFLAIFKFVLSARCYPRDDSL